MQSTTMQSTQKAVKEYGYFAGNQWRNAVDNQVFEVHEPYSGKLFARVAAGTRADGRTAVAAAAGCRRQFHAMERRQRPILAGRHITCGRREHCRGEAI